MTKHASKIVILVDDDLDDQQMLEDAFLEINNSLEILTFSSGKEVLAFLETYASLKLPCLIIIDYNIPDIKGLDIANRIFCKAPFRKTPVVIWSASDSKNHISDCVSIGCKAYFVKPLARSTIMAMAWQMLRYCA